MKRTLSIAIAVLTIGLLGSCSKINERLDNLEKEVSGIENEQIASINSQISGITSSISDLGQIRSDISSLKQSAENHGQDIFALQEADETLGNRIDNLEDYLDNVLPNYAEKEWVEATFSTLEQYEATCDTIAKIDARIGALDAKLSKDIKATADSLTKWVNKQFEGYYTAAQMDAKLAQMKADIDSSKASGKISDAKADSIATELTNAKAAVDTAKANIRAEYRAAIDTAIKASEGKLTKELTDAIATVNGKIESLTTRVGNLETSVADLKGRVDKLEGMIQSVVIVPAYSDGSVEAVNGILTLKCIVSPAEAISGMESLKDSLLLYADSVKVKTKATTPAYMTIEVSEASVLDAAQGAITLKANISEYLPKGENKALTIAVNIKNGISHFTTEFVPVTVTTKPIATVTFDLNGITGTAPTPQTIEKDGKITKPADPTDAIHTFAGWYKTKDATTGALSDQWDFDNGTVTADMTLYAKWTRTLGSIYGTNENVPKSDNNSAPDNAWESGDGGKAFIAYSGKSSEVLYFYKKLEPSGAKQLSCRKTENFTKIGDDYVLDYYLSSSFYGKYTLHMTEGKFTSVTYNGAGTDYEALSGTYAAPTAK